MGICLFLSLHCSADGCLPFLHLCPDWNISAAATKECRLIWHSRSLYDEAYCLFTSSNLSRPDGKRFWSFVVLSHKKKPPAGLTFLELFQQFLCGLGKNFIHKVRSTLGLIITTLMMRWPLFRPHHQVGMSFFGEYLAADMEKGGICIHLADVFYQKCDPVNELPRNKKSSFTHPISFTLLLLATGISPLWCHTRH